MAGQQCQAGCLGSQQLVYTIEKVDQFPRLRILVVGKSGIGKSTLINRVFGVDEARVEDNKRGMAHIDTELTSPLNDRFVLHDSRGFESGDKQNFRAVEDFIRRKTGPDIREQLHAIWLCFEIPLNDHGERFMERGMQDFLQRKQDILGAIPVIFVFTKFDRVIDLFQLKYGEAPILVERLAKRHLQQYCIDPIAKITKYNNFKYAVVTMRSGYEDKYKRLIQLTCQMISDKFDGVATSKIQG